MADYLEIGNDHRVSVKDLTDYDGTVLTAATVEATLLEDDGMTEATGVAWPVTLIHEGAGTYRAIIDKAVDLIRGDIYILRVVATQGGINAEWDISLKAWYRTQ